MCMCELRLARVPTTCRYFCVQREITRRAGIKKAGL